LGTAFFVALFVCSTEAQDTGTASTEFFGKGTAVTVMVHDASGNPIRAAAMVKLFHGGTMPAGQAQTESGRAELVVTELGDFTAVIAAPGYASVQRDFSVGAAGKTQVDVYLRALSADAAPPPGRPVLAPKAKKAVDEGLQALSADNLGQAQKQASKAMLLAPGHPDVLYLQGIVLLKQREWSRAQETLEKATQVDPAHSNAFAALGMALCDQGKYEAAVTPLEKALQLQPGAFLGCALDSRPSLLPAGAIRPGTGVVAGGALVLPREGTSNPTARRTISGGRWPVRRCGAGASRISPQPLRFAGSRYGSQVAGWTSRQRQDSHSLTCTADRQPPVQIPPPGMTVIGHPESTHCVIFEITAEYEGHLYPF